MSLTELVRAAAERSPDAPAISLGAETLTYLALDRESDRAAHALKELGVRRGDRVALWLEKSPRAVAAMQGILRIGASYVPVDPLSPAARSRTIFEDARVRAIVSRHGLMASLGRANHACLSIDAPVEGPRTLLWEEIDETPPLSLHEDVGEDELAFILYTSGSTGIPKGVCISHKNALAFVDWWVKELEVSSSDRLSNHAPFHFDLSVWDLYGAFRAGAQVSIVPEAMSHAAGHLASFLVSERISIWYSVPSALMLMMDKGSLLEVAPEGPRVVLFAGEVFPMKHLRSLRRAWAGSRFFNLYGPTETNVCLFSEVHEISDDQQAIPVGRPCCGDTARVLRPDGCETAIDEEGELFVTGPTVMKGYWGKPPVLAETHATGDLVRRDSDGSHWFVGRRDHMVKVRGYRVELGEVEAALLKHPAVREAAVVLSGTGAEARLVAFLVTSGAERLSLVAVKGHCATLLPRYMIVDQVMMIAALPRTRNGKLDRRALSHHSPNESGGSDGPA